MRLEFDGLYQKHEVKTSKKGNEYILLECLDPLGDGIENIFIFDMSKLDIIKKLKQNDNVVIVFNGSYDLFKKSYKLYANDVVPC